MSLSPATSIALGSNGTDVQCFKFAKNDRNPYAVLSRDIRIRILFQWMYQEISFPNRRPLIGRGHAPVPAPIASGCLEDAYRLSVGSSCTFNRYPTPCPADMQKITAYFPQWLSCQHIQIHLHGNSAMKTLAAPSAEFTTKHCCIVFFLLIGCFCAQHNRSCNVCCSLIIMSTHI